MPLRIAVPDLVSNSYFPAVAAVEFGFLDAEVSLLFPVTRTMEALRDGQLDFVAGAAHATLHAFPEWQGARLLCAVAQRMYWFLVVRADLGAQRGQVDAVRGLRIGAAPGPDEGLRQLLVEAGIDAERDGVHIGPIPGTAETGVSFGVTAARALEEGTLDGFWANGMGAELAVRRGVGTVVLDVRRGDGPLGAPGYTFPALVTTERLIEESPETVIEVVRALIRAQERLRADPATATEVGQRRFPAMEAGLIAELIRRDLPFYSPVITPEAVASLNAFARTRSLLKGAPRYEDVVVGEEVRRLWTEAT